MGAPEIIGCDESIWKDQVYKCSVIGYGSGYTMTVDMGDDQGGDSTKTFNAAGKI